MIVFGSSVSPFVRKVLFFLGEKGLQTEHMPIGPHDPHPDFCASSPFGKIPAFSDGDFRLADSSAICHYLERKYPANPLFPADPEDYGRAIWFDEYCDGLMFPPMGKIFFNLFVKPRLLKQEPDMVVVQEGIDALPAIFDYLESVIKGPFLVGNSLSIADISICSPFVNLAMVGHAVDGAKWPKLAAYVAAIHARPAFAAIKDRRADKAA